MIILPLMKLPIIYGSNETNQNSEAPSDNSSRFQNKLFHFVIQLEKPHLLRDIKKQMFFKMEKKLKL